MGGFLCCFISDAERLVLFLRVVVSQSGVTLSCCWARVYGAVLRLEWKPRYELAPLPVL